MKKISSFILAIVLVLTMVAGGSLSAYAAAGNDKTFTVKTSSQGNGYTQGDGSYSAGETVYLEAFPDDDYRFAGWFDNSSDSKVSSSATYNVNVRRNINVYAKFISKNATAKEKSEENASTNNVGKLDNTKTPTVVTTKTPTVATTTKAPVQTTANNTDVVALMNEAIKVSSNKVAVVNVKNLGSVSAATLKAVSDAAKAAGKTAYIYADTSSTDGKGVQGRFYLEPDKLSAHTADLDLGVYTMGTDVTKVKSMFEKTFPNNKIAVVQMTQTGNLESKQHIAARVDLTGLETKNLFFYSYDSVANKFLPISEPNYSIDNTGYLHFYTQQTGYIVISDKALAK